MRLFSIFEVWTCKNVMCPVCSAPWICERLTERFSTDGVLIRFVGVVGGGGGSRVRRRKWLLGRFVTQESMYGTFVRVLFNRIERWVTTKNVCCFSQSHSPSL